MHRWSRALAFMAGAVLITTVTGTALAQEESPAPEASMAAEASPAAEVVEPSTLSILQVATDKTAGTKLKGKKLKKAVAKAAPGAARYVIDSAGADPIERIIGLSLAARAADEAGDSETGAALIDAATLLYRNEWTRTKRDPASLNAAIEEAVTAAGLTGDAALLQVAIWDRWIDMCYDPAGPWFGVNDADPAMCADEGGTPVRADFTGIVPDASTSPEEIEPVDAGGLGIHKVTQDASANDKLSNKAFKKALAKELKTSGATILGYYAGDSSAELMKGIIDLVLLAREADEAGNAKAAKAFMALALAAYREGLTSWEQGPEEFNTALNELGYEIYDGESAFALFPPGGMEDICLFNKKTGDGFFINPAELWLCATADGRVLRVSYDDIDESKNGMPGFYKG